MLVEDAEEAPDTLFPAVLGPGDASAVVGTRLERGRHGAVRRCFPLRPVLEEDGDDHRQSASLRPRECAHDIFLRCRGRASARRSAKPLTDSFLVLLRHEGWCLDAYLGE